MSSRQLIKVLKEESVRWGTFTLKSGTQSDLYVDVRQTALHANGSLLIAKALLEVLHPEATAVGGVELGAVPIVGSVIVYHRHHALREMRIPSPLHGFIVRKQEKAHGLGNKIERCPPAGTKVCIIEDVTTTGGSLSLAVQAALLADLDVLQVITVVDRQEGAREFLRMNGYLGVFTALVTRDDLV